MRRTILATIASALLAVPPAASASGDEEWRPTAGGWVSGAAEFVTTVPTDAGTAVDAVRHGQYLYTTSWRSFSIYDVSSPLQPTLLSQTPTPGSIFNEQPQTNGKLLLLSHDNMARTLEIYDVRDKTRPVKIGSYADTARNHIWTCVLDCDYVYGGTGTILDLSDPSAPVKIGDWTNVHRPRAFHAIDEVAPGLVMTGSDPVLLLDARSDPANPTLLRTLTPKTTQPPRPYIIIGGAPTSLPARIVWPGDAPGRYLLMTMETPFSGDCAEHSGGVVSYDTTAPEGFRQVDEYKMTGNGLPSSGSTPVNLFGCTAYGLADNDSYSSNGLVSATFFEHGVRVLRVGDDGRFAEVGGFLAHGANAAGVVWRNDEVLYVLDLHRGIDVIRIEDGD